MESLNPSPCPSCRSSNVYRTVKPIGSGGGYAPNLLSGLGDLFRSPKVDVVVCEQCGLIRQYAQRESRAKLSKSKKWKRV